MPTRYSEFPRARAPPPSRRGGRVHGGADRQVDRFRAGDRAVVVIASGANRVDAAKVAALLGLAVRRADADFIRDRTGFAIGGVAPLGHLAPPLIVFDRDLLALHPIYAAAGSPSHVFRTEAETLVRITGAPVADIRQDG